MDSCRKRRSGKDKHVEEEKQKKCCRNRTGGKIIKEILNLNRECGRRWGTEYRKEARQRR
jgi:hypothetical protein